MQDNDRLLKRLLRLVSPAEAERLQGKESNLEQKVVDLAEENSRLHSENALLLEEVEALKLEAGEPSVRSSHFVPLYTGTGAAGLGTVEPPTRCHKLPAPAGRWHSDAAAPVGMRTL